MANSKWIWLGGDFEIYHAMLQNLRREEYGIDKYIPMWRTDAPRPVARFYKIAILEKEEKMTAYANGKGYVTPQDVKGVAMDVLRHRILLTYEAEAENITSDKVIDKILAEVPVP